MTFDDYLLQHGIDRSNPMTDVSRVPELYKKFQFTNANKEI